jgi:hypothetical protein
MYDPKVILTEEGYEEYRAHLVNIRNGIFFISNHADDLHIGALDQSQLDDWYTIDRLFEKLLPVLKKGDGEHDESDTTSPD